MKLKIVIYILCLCILVWVATFFISNPSVYNEDYWSDIGLINAHLYQDVRNVFGEPICTDMMDDNYCRVHYANIDFVWSNKDLKGIFIRAEITTDKFVFGKEKIRVGSSLKDVKKAYRSRYIKEMRDLYDYTGYIDGNTRIMFEFDDKNIVKKIILSHGP